MTDKEAILLVGIVIGIFLIGLAILHGNFVKRVVKDFFTEDDGVSFDPATTLVVIAGMVMIGQFVRVDSHEYLQLALGIAALTGGKAGLTAVQRMTKAQNVTPS